MNTRSYMQDFNEGYSMDVGEKPFYKDINFYKKASKVILPLVAAGAFLAACYGVGCAIDGPEDHMRDKQAKELRLLSTRPITLDSRLND